MPAIRDPFNLDPTNVRDPLAGVLGDSPTLRAISGNKRSKSARDFSVKVKKGFSPNKASGANILRSVKGAVTGVPAGLNLIATKGVPAAIDYLTSPATQDYAKTLAKYVVSRGGIAPIFGEAAAGAGREAVGRFSEDPEAATAYYGDVAANWAPGIGDAKAVGEMLREAALMRDAGDIEGANRLESLIVPVAAAGFIPEVGALAVKGARGATRAASKTLAARPTYTRTTEGPFNVIRREGLETQPMPEALETRSLAALRGLAQDRSRSPAIRAADEAAMATRGVPYDEAAPMPTSSLQRQAGIGRAYRAAVEGSPEYKSAVFERYGEMMPEVVEQAKAQNLDQLTEAAYRQLGTEAAQQFDVLPLEMRYHTGPGEYASSTDMIQDALGRGRLNVFSGGEPHEFLNQIDPATGLSQNEMFRAVHDYMGHVVPGSQFGPSGEEIAYAAHAQQLSPLAQMALLSETRGQNSFVNYSPANVDVITQMNTLRRQRQERKIANAMVARGDRDAAKWLEALPSEEEIASGLREAGQRTEYAPQRAVLLPPEFLPTMSPGGTPDWLRTMLQPEAALSGVRGVHISKASDLAATDPSFYGSGARGSDYARVTGAGAPNRTFFYSGPQGTVVPEESVMGMVGGEMRKGPRYGYETELGGLYDVNADPERLVDLAKAYNLPGYKPEVPYYALRAEKGLGLEGRSAITDMERLVRDYGYGGYLSDYGRQRAAAMFDPVSGLRPIEAGPKGYAEGGHASGYSE